MLCHQDVGSARSPGGSIKNPKRGSCTCENFPLISPRVVVAGFPVPAAVLPSRHMYNEQRPSADVPLLTSPLLLLQAAAHRSSLIHIRRAQISIPILADAHCTSSVTHNATSNEARGIRMMDPMTGLKALERGTL